MIRTNRRNGGFFFQRRQLTQWKQPSPQVEQRHLHPSHSCALLPQHNYPRWLLRQFPSLGCQGQSPFSGRRFERSYVHYPPEISWLVPPACVHHQRSGSSAKPWCLQTAKSKETNQRRGENVLPRSAMTWKSTKDNNMRQRNLPSFAWSCVHEERQCK